MKFHKFVIVILVTVYMYLGASLPAQPGNHKGNLEKRLAHMKVALVLNEGQVQKIRAIGERFRPARMQHRTKIKALHQEIRLLLQSESPERSIFKKKLEEIGQLKIAMRLSGFDQRQAVARVLTTEQQTRWKELMQKRMRHQKGKRGHRNQGPGKF